MSYNKLPHTVVQAAEGDLQRGYPAIVERLKKEIVNKKRFVLAVEIYPGVRDEELQPVLRSLSPQLFIDTTETLCSRKAFESRIGPYLTDDRVFGRMYYGEWSDFQNVRRKNVVCKAIQSATGLVIVYGMGAAELVEPDLILYCDLARWEIQQRFRKGIPNYYSCLLLNLQQRDRPPAKWKSLEPVHDCPNRRWNDCQLSSLKFPCQICPSDTQRPVGNQLL